MESESDYGIEVSKFKNYVYITFYQLPKARSL